MNWVYLVRNKDYFLEIFESVKVNGIKFDEKNSKVVLHDKF
jgi:hypothetical protein